MLDLETRLNRHASQLDALAPEIDVHEIRSVSAAGRPIRVSMLVEHRRTVIALAILALGLIAAGVGYSLRTETVEEGPQLGKFLEMEISSDGLPFLVYSDSNTGGTVFAKCLDRFCEEDPVLTRFDGAFPSVMVRDDGRPLIWIDGPDGEPVGPWLLDCSNASCSEYLQIDVTSIPTQIEDVSSTGRALMRMWDDAGQRLVLGMCADAGCLSGITEMTVVDEGYPPSYDAFFGPGERPFLVYATGETLLIGTCTDPDCTDGLESAEIAAGEFHDGTPVAATTGPDGDVWVAHGRYGIQIAHCADRTCGSVETTPLASNERAWRIEALVGGDGLPVFVYSWSDDSRTDVLKVARCRDAACTQGSVATTHSGREIGSFSATLGDAGYPVLGVRTDTGVVATVCADAGCLTGALDRLEWDHTAPPPSPPATVVTSTSAPATTSTSAPDPDVSGGIAFEPGSWTRIADYGEVFGDGVRISELVTFGDVLFALGSECQGPACRPVSWTSQDGRAWTKAAIDNEGEVRYAATTGTTIVAVGQVCDPDEACAIRVWSTDDGRAWSRSAPDTLPDCAGLTPFPECVWGLTAGPGRYVMYGFDADRTPMWTSADGAVWRSLDPGGDPGSLTLWQAVWITGENVVALASECAIDSPEEEQWIRWSEMSGYSEYFFWMGETGEHSWTSCRRYLWVSSDGITWTRATTNAFGTMLTWIEPVVTGSTLQLIGQACEDGWCPHRSYVSSDGGQSWESRPLEGIQEVNPGPVVATDDGFVSVAVVWNELDGERHSMMWTSDDGLRWAVHEFASADFPPEGTMPFSPVGSGIVLIADGIGNTLQPERAGVWTWYPG